MSSDKVFFDAGNPGALSNVQWVLVATALLFLVVGIIMICRPKLGRGNDPTANRGMGLAASLFGGAALVAIGAPYVMALRALSDLRSGKSQVIAGCVEHYAIERQSKSADTYFSVQGAPFHFSSIWYLPGYHSASDDIHAGQGLKITKRGDFVIRVQASPTVCPQSTAK
ncbi:MAG TPA: hypothetical protein VGL66_10925 [Caulobacteraceae bacterium]|jgi:hypothetical protein